MKCMKLEAGWILTNLAYGDEQCLQDILAYEQMNGLYTVSVLGFVKTTLEIQPYDLVLID